MMNDAPNTTKASRLKRWFALASAVSLLAALWLGLFPVLAQRPSIRERDALFKSHGIDPGAMFYTDLELLDDLLKKMDGYQQEHPRALWVPSR